MTRDLIFTLGALTGLVAAVWIIQPISIQNELIFEEFRKETKRRIKPLVEAEKERNCLKIKELKIQSWYKWNTPDSLVCECAEYN